MRYQPLAADLRKVMSALKLAGNLERIADESEGIARRARKVLKHVEVEESKLIEPVYHHASDILNKSIRIFRGVKIFLAKFSLS